MALSPLSSSSFLLFSGTESDQKSERADRNGPSSAARWPGSAAASSTSSGSGSTRGARWRRAQVLMPLPRRATGCDDERPPQTAMGWPLTYELSSLAKKSATEAISSGAPYRSCGLS